MTYRSPITSIKLKSPLRVTTSSALVTQIAPYSGTGLGEYLRDNGYDTLLSVDDFSKHGKLNSYFYYCLVSWQLSDISNQPKEGKNLCHERN